MRASARFTVDAFDTDPPHRSHGDVDVARTRVTKTFTGALEGTGTVEMLSASSPQGRGYVAVEWIEGVLDGVAGAFAVLHAATDPGQGWWPIVPGSGQLGLAGIRGEVRIDIADDGTHTITLDYHLEPTLR